ncbi:MAG TPA: M15 family metallopeptidase [Arenimonas sp.]|nr:M15 family metallopeptidase [Arenimonas sp.]
MLTPSEYRLINGHELDAVPACLYHAKANAHARILASSQWLIRDKRNGEYIAALSDRHMTFFRRSPWHQARLDGIAELLAGPDRRTAYRPLTDLEPHLAELGIDAGEYVAESGLSPVAEPSELEFAGHDRYRRPLWLEYDTSKAWHRLRRAAAADGVAIDAISGFRSQHYQMGIFRRKMARGLRVADILTVNAAPGFSEHHSGRAIDIGTHGEPAAEESFERTPAFDWLQRQAGRFGFRLSFPRGNSHGIGYEPWHWYWTGDAQS